MNLLIALSKAGHDSALQVCVFMCCVADVKTVDLGFYQGGMPTGPAEYFPEQLTSQYGHHHHHHHHDA